MTHSFRRAALVGVPLLALALTGCAKDKGELVVSGGVGVTALRSPCPTVGIPDYTGDITLFTSPDRTDEGAIDVSATMTRLRSQCNDAAGDPKLYTSATFEVYGTRTDTHGARQVQLPYFVTVVRGGGAVVSKRVGTVTLNFADGQGRAAAQGQAGAFVDRAEATLPDDIKRKLSEKRRAGEEDAAIDPLSLPEVKAALARATFEVLVGFQLDRAQLAYNVTR
ncbi:MAG: hypothetical protein KGL48_15015 [Sphingomonadales bacterium]|nr:hypothetical protein [Sphingomonadales bacterium]MDE2567622.1 hypothetical protein [Sphingomonadales bacterium]